MGFLGVNIRKRSGTPKIGASKRLKSGSVSPAVVSRASTPPRALTPPEPSPRSLIEQLPCEILEMIFLLSENLNMPQASWALAHKLSRTHNLELAMLRTQLETHDHQMPTYVVHWHFVTTELLAELEFAKFVGPLKDNTSNIRSDPFVPFSIESQLGSLDDTSVDPADLPADQTDVLELTAFMVKRGCRVEDSLRAYRLFAKHGFWDAIGAMISNKQRTNYEVIVMALEAGQGADLAIQLLNLTHGLEQDWSQIWAIQQAATHARVPEVIAYINTG